VLHHHYFLFLQSEVLPAESQQEFPSFRSKVPKTLQVVMVETVLPVKKMKALRVVLLLLLLPLLMMTMTMVVVLVVMPLKA